MISFTQRLIRKISFPFFITVLAAAMAQAQPNLLSPSNNSFVETTTPALLWEKLEDANVYVVTVFSDRRGARQIVKFTVRGHSCLVSEGYLEPGRKYWWTVAPSRNGVIDEPSRMWSFTVSQAEAADPETAAESQPATDTGDSNSETFQTVAESGTQKPAQWRDDALDSSVRVSKPKRSGSRYKEPQEDGKSAGIGLGLGFGIPYGILGANIDISMPDIPDLNVSAGVGTTILAGVGYNVGLKYYVMPVDNTCRARVSAYYGVNGILSILSTVDSNTAYTGISLGLGEQCMWGPHKADGLDFDLMIIATSGLLDKYNELRSAGSSAADPGRVKFSIGYRHKF
ncbi:MAG: hypothetical protein NTX59_11955 [Elusimicrobia bacterium]|nr:hypothetical protein [Elusimicrobiota bacterium]